MRPSFYEVGQFPQLAKFAKQWEIIRDEFLLLNKPIMSIHRAGKSREEVYRELTLEMQSGKQFGWLLGWGKSGVNPDWLAFPLMVQDTVVPFITTEMKKTIAMLKELKGIKVCSLLKMKPNTFLPTHNHPEVYTEGLLQYHLPLQTASTNNYAYLNVNGEFRQHASGKPFVFDGSLNHFAVNASNVERTIVYIEFDKSVHLGY